MNFSQTYGGCFWKFSNEFFVVVFVDKLHCPKFPAGNYMLKVNNSDTRTTPMTSFWCLSR